VKGLRKLENFFFLHGNISGIVVTELEEHVE
jgi:hypothetical protein